MRLLSAVPGMGSATKPSLISNILSTVIIPLHNKIPQELKADKPIISVIVITYNQEKTVAQALESILCQKGTFKLEVVIGEDASTDGTLAICEGYAQLHPEIIKLLAGEPNLGIMRNFTRCIGACTGDYVAILAGDDYWCDENKLQKQLDYIAVHPECGVVCTDGYRLMVKKGKKLPGLPPYNPVPDGDIKEYYHNRYGGVYAMPLTLLIRRDLLMQVDFNAFLRLRFPVEDYPMQSVLAHITRFGYITDRTAVYRVYKESATHISFDHPRYMAYHKGLTDIRRYLHSLFPEDVPFTEEWAQDYVFYKEFLLFLLTGQYTQAKSLVKEAPPAILGTSHYRHACLATKTRLHFAAFRWYKKHRGQADV